MFRWCGAQSTPKLRENPNRRGFAGIGKRLESVADRLS
jgi:hypothetical protein